MKIDKLPLKINPYDSPWSGVIEKINELIDAHNAQETKASKECDCDSPICVNRDHESHKINFKELLKAAEAIKKYHHPGTEEESQAPHETPTKTCTCPHCDYARCDRCDHL